MDSGPQHQPPPRPHPYRHAHGLHAAPALQLQPGRQNVSIADGCGCWGVTGELPGTRLPTDGLRLWIFAASGQ